MTQNFPWWVKGSPFPYWKTYSKLLISYCFSLELLQRCDGKETCTFEVGSSLLSTPLSFIKFPFTDTFRRFGTSLKISPLDPSSISKIFSFLLVHEMGSVQQPMKFILRAPSTVWPTRWMHPITEDLPLQWGLAKWKMKDLTRLTVFLRSWL